MGERVLKTDRSTRYIPAALKLRLWGQPCVICGCTGTISIDHIVPHSMGGTSDESNLQPLCDQCNKKKSDRLSNEELKQWFESRKDEHFAYHAYQIATQGLNAFDRPSFREWRAQNAK